MNDNEQIRLTDLERAFAEGSLTQHEILELETLRDEAGQGWLFASEPQEHARELIPERSREVIPDCGVEIARRQGTPLRGHDGGEQVDLFGQGLLL